MGGVTNQPPDTLLALAWHGAFTSLRGQSAYFGRYAVQGRFDAEEVKALLDQGLAEAQASVDAYPVVFPTRAGLEEAAKRKPSQLGDQDRIRVVLGSREWEDKVNGRAPLVGIFLTQKSSQVLTEGLLAVLSEAPRPASAHLETIGGLVPAALAADMAGEAVEGAPGFELVSVPAAAADLVDVARRYRFVLDVRPRAGTAVAFQLAGPNPRLLGPLTLSALAAAIKATHPSVADSKEFGELDVLLGEYEEKLEVLL